MEPQLRDLILKREIPGLPDSPKPLNQAQQTWEYLGPALLEEFCHDLRSNGFRDVQVLSRHIGWGRVDLGAVTQPHYIMADGAILQIAPPCRVTRHCQIIDGWLSSELLPYRNEDDKPRYLRLKNMYVNLMCYSRGHLHTWQVGTPTIRRLKYLQQGSIRRNSHKHFKILTAIAAELEAAQSNSSETV